MSFLNIPIPSLVVPKQTFSAPGALRGIAGIPSTRMAVIGSGRFENYRPLRETMEGSKRIEFKFIEASWKGELVLGQIRESLLALEEFKPDCIVAMGGGRILDGCKLLWAFYEHPNLEAQRLYIAFSIPELRRKARFCMVPTTNGTGSECSSSAVYTETGTGRKIPVVSHDFLPDVAILDPELLSGTPASQLCIGILDTVSHAVEGFCSKIDNPVSESLVSPVLSTAFRAADRLANDPDDPAALLDAQIASFWAGIVQNTMLVGPAHALAHQLGGTGVPHGLATGVLTPLSMRLLAEKAGNIRTRLESLAFSAGFSSIDELADRIRRVFSQFGLEPCLSNWAGISRPMPDVGKKALEDRISRFFPVELEASDLQSLFEQVW